MSERGGAIKFSNTWDRKHWCQDDLPEYVLEIPSSFCDLYVR